jgi:thymidylate kinase
MPDDAARRTLPVVAVTGSDGAGKSTLVAQLLAHLRNEYRVATIYLGQSSGRIAAWIASIPLLGPSVHRYLTQKADRVHARPEAAPGNATALAIYLLSRWRAYKFRRMLSLCRRGFLVVADRYPQSTTPGFLFDGPQLAKTSGGNWWIRALRARERALYDRMAEPQPMLVIRLNIDAETAHARKPDHSLATLRKKAAFWPRLQFNAAQILEQDARSDAAAVLDASLRAIRRSLSGARA